MLPAIAIELVATSPFCNKTCTFTLHPYVFYQKHRNMMGNCWHVTTCCLIPSQTVIEFLSLLVSSSGSIHPQQPSHLAPMAVNIVGPQSACDWLRCMQDKLSDPIGRQISAHTPKVYWSVTLPPLHLKTCNRENGYDISCQPFTEGLRRRCFWLYGCTVVKTLNSCYIRTGSARGRSPSLAWHCVTRGFFARCVAVVLWVRMLFARLSMCFALGTR